MVSQPQRVAASIGESGCYFLSILYFAEALTRQAVDALVAYQSALDAGYIDSECFVKDPAKLMQMLTGSRWMVRKAGPGHELPLDYALKAGELEILRYERRGNAHFVVGSGRGTVAFDPYGVSATVMSGQMVSRRIFTKI
jgi:hypothetical protein